MKQIITNHLLRGADAPTVSAFFLSFLSGISTTLLTWLEVYSGEIGAACTILSLFCMIFFGIANGRKLDKSTDNSNRLNIVDQHIEDMEKALGSKLVKIEKLLESKGDANAKKTKRNTKN